LVDDARDLHSFPTRRSSDLQGSGWTKYLRKPFEAIYTLGIETFWGKQRILEVYLNVAEMGPGIYGIEAAAQTYFHKPASQLSQRSEEHTSELQSRENLVCRL